MVGECPLFQNGYYREILNKTNIDKIAASMRKMIKDKYTPITFLFKAKGDNDYSKNVKFTVRDLSSPFTISEDLIRISMDVLIHVRNINSYNFELKIENLEESLEEVDLHDLFVDDDVVDFGEDNSKESAEELLNNSIEIDMPDILRRYFDLYREGIISKEEFEDKKKKLLEL